MQVLERVIENYTVGYAKKRYGIFVTKNNLLAFRGMPDRTFWLHGGRPLLIEFKRTGEVPTPLQWQHIRTLRELGYNVEVCDNKEDGRRIIDRYATSMDTAQLSSSRRGVLPTTIQRGIISRSRNGKDKRRTKGRKHSSS